VLGFFVILIPLVVLAPQKNTAEFVFTAKVDADVWPNYGIAFCIGLTTSTFPFVGYDAASHMSEEVKDPKLTIPRAMIGTILTNGLLGFGMIIALLFTMGDPTTLLESPVSLAGYPFIQIYYNAVQSLPGTNAMTAVSLVIVIMANFGLQAGCSRTAWAFSRDKGLPASGFLDHVNPRSQVPVRAIMLSVVIQSLLGLINIGSSTAFNAFVNSAAVTLYITYVSTSQVLALPRHADDV
jgi:choline transport protein